MKSIRKICLLFAMRAEARGVIETLSLMQKEYEDKAFSGEFFQGEYDGKLISLFTNGTDDRFGVDLIGPVPASICAYSALKYSDADVLISCGTAGGFAGKGARIGTIYLSKERCVFHDRRVPLPGFDQSAVGSFAVADVEALAQDLGFNTGVISSGSSLLKSESDISAMRASGAVVKEMEAAAIAWVCSLYKTPFFAVKSITNLLDQELSSETQFVDNFSKATASLTVAVMAVVERLDAKF